MRCFCRRDGVRKGVRVDGDKVLYCMFCNFGTHKEKPTTSDGTNELCYEDDVVVGFQTRKKKAQEHFLVIPKRHIGSIKDLTLTSEEDRKLLHHMLRVGKKLMKAQDFVLKHIENQRATATDKNKKIRTCSIGVCWNCKVPRKGRRSLISQNATC